MLTKSQVKVILLLLDNRGHAEWELAGRLKMQASNLNPLLKELEDDLKIIYKGRSRLSKRPHIKNGDYREFPYYLNKNLETIKAIIKNLVEANLRESWFIFKIIGSSKYLESMRMKFKEDVDVVIEGELLKSPIFSDSDYLSLIQGRLHFLELAPDPEEDEIRYWYYQSV
jgi:predicted transcriptional regulator